jgi:hypothetical protein
MSTVVVGPSILEQLWTSARFSWISCQGISWDGIASCRIELHLLSKNMACPIFRGSTSGYDQPNLRVSTMSRSEGRTQPLRDNTH